MSLLHADLFNKEAFRKAMTVIFAHAAYLDAAQCFALLPIATLLRRTGREDAAVLNFNIERQTTTLTANRLYGSAAAWMHGTDLLHHHDGLSKCLTPGVKTNCCPSLSAYQIIITDLKPPFINLQRTLRMYII